MQPGTEFASTTGAALQLALWSLEYNQMPSSGPMTIADPNTPFQVNSSTASTIIADADTYLSDAYGQSEDTYFLNLNTASEETTDANNGQGVFCTDLLDFTNTPKAVPSINTSQQPATRHRRHVDRRPGHRQRRLHPTGTVTFNLYSNSTGTAARRCSPTPT